MKERIIDDFDTPAWLILYSPRYGAKGFTLGHGGSLRSCVSLRNDSYVRGLLSSAVVGLGTQHDEQQFLINDSHTSIEVVCYVPSAYR
jgi:hypothetical protein